MSSACVCHTDEWCFYCEMYVPLEKERDSLIATQAQLKLEISRLSSRVINLQNRLSQALDDLEEPSPRFRMDASGNLHRIEEDEV